MFHVSIKELKMFVVRVFLAVYRDEVVLYAFFNNAPSGCVELGWLNKSFEEFKDAREYANFIRGSAKSAIWPNKPDLPDYIGDKVHETPCKVGDVW